MWTVGGRYQEEMRKEREAYESDLNGETPGEGVVVLFGQLCRAFVLFFRDARASFDCSEEIRVGYGMIK